MCAVHTLFAQDPLYGVREAGEVLAHPAWIRGEKGAQGFVGALREGPPLQHSGFKVNSTD